jgi:hypothetical protein
LKNSLQPEGAENFAAELQAFEQAVPEAARAARARKPERALIRRSSIE